MSQTIDSRVVEMKFDNKNFEKNVAESMKTLENLDKRLTKLEETDVHLDKIGKAADSFDLSKIDKALDSITHRFSIMGQVGASVIHNLTTDAYNMVKTFNSKVWGTVFGQMKTGGKARAENVENAKFLLEGMGITYGKEVEDQISDAVADTAFGFDEAAMAMAQLSGASVQLGDDMDKALKGISGVAAMTNRSFSDIADIFVDAAATGKVSADTFNRLSERGLAAKGIMQEFYGVNATELDKLAKKGAITFNDFSKAMYDAFGTQAKKSNETLSGVIANTKAVLSRMGQSFYQPLMANNSDLVKMFQTLKDVMKQFEGPVKEIGAQLSGYVLQLARYGTTILEKIDVSKYLPMFDNFKKVFENLYFSAQNLYTNILKPFGKQFKAAFYEVFPSLNTGKGILITISDKLVEASQKFREFTADIGLFGEKGISVRDTLVAIFNTLKLGVKILKTASEVLKVVIKAISKGLGSINFSGMLANLTNFITEAGEIGLFIISGITVGLTSAIPLLFNAISNVGNAIISAFCSFFGIASPSKVMRDKVGYWLVAGIAEGIKSALKAGLITGAILLVTGLILSTFKKEGESVIDVASRLFDGFVDKIGGVVNRISKWFGDSSFGKAFNATFETIAVVMTKLSKAISTFNVERAKELVGVIKQFVMLGTYVYLLIQFATASTMFTSALFKISRAADAFVRNYRIKYLGATLKNLAIAIGIVVGSILLFAGMIEGGHGDALLKGLIAVGGIIAALVVAINLIQGVVKSENVDPHGLIKVEAMFVGLGAAIYLIASAIRKVGRLDLPNLIAGTVTIGMFLFAITGLMLAVEAVSSQLPKDSSISDNIWIPLLAIAVSIRIIAGAISKVARIDPKNVWRAAVIVGALTAVVGGITLLSQLITTIDTGGGSHKILGVAFMVIALGFAIKTITTAIVLLSYVPEELIQQGIETMRKIMGWLTALLFFSWFAQKTLGSILLGFAATVVSIAGSIWLIGQMKEGLAQGISSVIGILTIITAFIGAVNMVNKATGGGGLNSGTKALLYAAACIAAMGAVVYAAGQLSWGQIGKGLVVVTVLTGFAVAVGLLFGMLSGDVTGPKAKGLKAFKNGGANITKSLRTIMIIKTVVNQLIKLAAVAVILAKIPLSEDEITKSMLMLAGVMGVLTVLILAAGAATDKFPNVQKITKPLMALTAAVAIIAGALVIMGQMESPATVITSAAAISVILLAMGKVLEKAKVFGVQGMSTKGIAAAALLIVSIGAALTLMIAAIGEFSLNKLGTVALAVGALSAVLLAIAAAMKIADKTQVSMKSAGAIILGSLSLVVIAATIALFAYYVDDMAKATQAAVILSGVFLVIGVTLKIAESVHWSVAGGILLASLTFVAIAASVAILAYYMDDLKRADEAAWILAGLMVTLGAVLAVLAAISAGTGGVGAGLILAIAGAMAIAGLAMVELAAAVAIAVYALGQLIAILTPDNASQVVAFFETIGDGIGTAGQHIADGVKTAAIAIHDAVTAIKEETGHIGFDFIDGFAKGISKFSPIVGIAAAAVGLLSLSSLRNAIDSHSKSKETYDVGYDYDDGLAQGINDYSDMPKNAAQNVGTGILDNLKNTLIGGLKSTNLADIGEGLKKSFSGWDWGKTAKLFTAKGMLTGVNTVWKGIGSAFGKNAVEGVQNGIKQATSSATTQGSGNGLMDMVTGLFGGLTSGNFDNVLGGFDWTTLLGGDGISGLKDYLSEAGVSMDNLSGDNIPKLIEQLKGAGLAGDDLINALKELGITEEQLQNLGLADKLGLDTAKEGAKELKTTIQDLADEIIKGKFGNAPERWDRMFEALIKSGKTAEEAYAAIADAQNEVNKRLGSSVVHTADEMSKKVSDSVKKANKAQADANAKAKGETGKPGKDFKKDPHKAVTDTSASDAAMAAEEQMKRNMPYANYMAAKEHQITAEREKQTAEAMKQKLANEHLYTLKEKEQAMAGLKANQEIANHATLTAEKQKQLDAENRKYQAVVDTYNKHQEMLKVIQEQEAATKKAEEAEKKRGEAAAKATTGVQYGSAEYEKQKKGTTINNRKTIVKSEMKPIQAETKVEMTPKLEVKNIDVSQYKEQIVAKVESQVKELNSKVDITPKINTSQAETQIANFKQKTQELKTSIPQTFEGIAQKVSEHFTKISSMVITGGGKLTANTRSVFQNAVAAATGVLTGSETISKFYNAGKQATDGYVRGLKSNLAAVKSAGAEIAKVSANATKKTLKEHSPSKVFYGIGENGGIGYGNGMLSTISYVANASEQMANASLDSVYRVVDAVQNAVNEGMDITPTITPVFDSINVQNGLGDVSSMMDFSQRDLASITANIDAKANYDNSQVEAMQSRMSDMQDAFNNLADILNNQETPTVNANVILQGDADGVFKLVQNSNNRYTKMHGKSAFA